MFSPKAHSKKLLALCLFTLLLSSACWASAAKADTAKAPLQGIVVENEVSDELERLGIRVRLQQGVKNSLIVDTIKQGSPAMYGGIESGDKLLNITANSTMLALTIERSGHQYQCLLERDTRTPLAARAINDFLKGYVNGVGSNDLQGRKPALAGVHKMPVPVLDVVPQRPPVLDVSPGGVPVLDVTEPVAYLAKNYNIELILDISDSMNEVDGTGQDVSKFQWCRDQVKGLAKKLAPYKPNITITVFNSLHATFLDCDGKAIEDIYSHVDPDLYTNLLAPLMERAEAGLEKGRKEHKKTVIAVITDGRPNIPADITMINRALISFTRKIKSDDEVRITILQIGDGFKGRDFCLDLDENLVKQGASYDIVDTKTFAEVKQIGITQSLIDAVAHTKSALVKIRPDATQLFKQHEEPHLRATTAGPNHVWRRIDDVESEQKSAEDLVRAKQERRNTEQQLLGQ